MVLIAFCAIDLVANVTNAQPVGEGETIGEGRGGREEGGRDKKKTKQDKKVWTTRYEPQITHCTENGDSQAHRACPGWLAHGERTQQEEHRSHEHSERQI